MPRRLLVLGSTGSIGTQALDALKAKGDDTIGSAFKPIQVTLNAGGA